MKSARADRWCRVTPFITVGVIGFVVQIAALAALTSLAHWNWLPATVVSVELAVLHNFLWHERWTWTDRTVAAASAPFARLLRFHVANGLISIAGNAALMAWLVGILGVPAVPANALAVGAMSVLNFVMADRWVFRARPVAPLERCPTYLAACVIVIAAATGLRADGGWDRTTSRRRSPPGSATWRRPNRPSSGRAQRRSRGQRRRSRPTGESIHVPSGTISDWRGAVFIPH